MDGKFLHFFLNNGTYRNDGNISNGEVPIDKVTIGIMEIYENYKRARLNLKLCYQV